MGVGVGGGGGVVSTILQSLYPWKIPGTHCTRGLLGLRASLQGLSKSFPSGI